MTWYLDHDAAWTTTDISADVIATANTLEMAAGLSLDSKLGILISVECAYGATANEGLKVYVLKDTDGTNYESSAEAYGFEMPKATSVTRRKTFFIAAEDAESIKIHLSNGSGASVTATVRYKYIIGGNA